MLKKQANGVLFDGSALRTNRYVSSSWLRWTVLDRNVFAFSLAPEELGKSFSGKLRLSLFTYCKEPITRKVVGLINFENRYNGFWHYSPCIEA